MLATLERLYPGRLQLRDERYVARSRGNRDVFKAVRRGRTAAEIEATWAADTASFARRRAPSLLYVVGSADDAVSD